MTNGAFRCVFCKAPPTTTLSLETAPKIISATTRKKIHIIQPRSQLPLVTVATIIVLIAIFGPLRDWAGAWIDRRFFHREFDYGRLPVSYWVFADARLR